MGQRRPNLPAKEVLHFIRLRAACGHASTVKAMIKAGCPVDAVDVNCVSVLHSAAQGGHAEVIREVLSTGFNINATNIAGLTPLHVAAGKGKTRAALELIRQGADKAVGAGRLTFGTPFIKQLKGVMPQL